MGTTQTRPRPHHDIQSSTTLFMSLLSIISKLGSFPFIDIFSFAKQTKEVDCTEPNDILPGHGIYVKLDEYFHHTCKDILLASPEHESELVTYVVSTFQRYTERVSIVRRMTNYINQHYVRRAIDEEKG